MGAYPTEIMTSGNASSDKILINAFSTECEVTDNESNI